MGSQRSCLRRGLLCSALQDLRMRLAAEFCTYWSGLMTVCMIVCLIYWYVDFFYLLVYQVTHISLKCMIGNTFAFSPRMCVQFLIVMSSNNPCLPAHTDSYLSHSHPAPLSVSFISLGRPDQQTTVSVSVSQQQEIPDTHINTVPFTNTRPLTSAKRPRVATRLIKSYWVAST